MLTLRQAFIVGLSFLATAAGADWRQFRGPETDGVAVQDTLPALDMKQNLAWKADLLGRGLSSPIVVGNRVFVTASSGQHNERLHVLAYDADTGRKLWQRTLAATGPTDSHPKSCMAAPTPASDGKVVVALFGTDDLVGLDLDGNVLWVRCLYPENEGASDARGLASSVVICRGVAVVHIENQNASFATGIDVPTGSTRWRIDRPRELCWTSPLLLPGKTPDQTLVLLDGSTRLSAIDPETGREVWGVAGQFHAIASGLFCNDMLYVPGSGMGQKGLLAYQVTSRMTAPRLLWEKLKLNPSTASPVAHAGRLYTLRGAVLVTADARSGEILGQLRLKGPFSASLILAGGRLYCVNEAGLAQVVKPDGKDGKVVEQCPFAETILATPAISGGAFYIRSDRHLWKIGKRVS